MLANALHINQQLVKIVNFYESVIDSMKSVIKLPENKAKELENSYKIGDTRVRQLQQEFALQDVNVQDFDVLVIDDSKGWQDVIVETFDSMYSCDVASTYKEAIEKIHSHHYKVISLSEPFHDSYQWLKVLKLLEKEFPQTPVIMVSDIPVEDTQYIQRRYPNIQEIILRGKQSDGTNFVDAIFDKLPKLLHK